MYLIAVGLPVCVRENRAGNQSINMPGQLGYVPGLANRLVSMADTLSSDPLLLIQEPGGWSLGTIYFCQLI